MNRNSSSSRCHVTVNDGVVEVVAGDRLQKSGSKLGLGQTTQFGFLLKAVCEMPGKRDRDALWATVLQTNS